MRGFVVAVALFGLPGCGFTVRSVIADYRRGMTARDSHPAYAAECFAETREGSADVMAKRRLSPLDRLVMASLRIRACVELGDDASAEATVAAHAGVFRELDPDARWPGDVAGIALLKSAWRKDPERALVEIVATEEHVTGAKMLAYLDLRKVALQIALATPRSIEAAVALCDAHPDDPRFKALREGLKK